MKPTTLPLNALHAHPDNANAMRPPLFRKLLAHLRETAQYPPIIIRPLPSLGEDQYQILDGHHRAAALRELGHAEAHCVVWDADDQQALVLLATLNRLQGEDDPHKRGTLIARLRESMPLKDISRRLPESVEKLEQLSALSRPPTATLKPTPLPELPVSLHFFVTPGQRTAIEKRLKACGGSRASALLSLLKVGDEHA